MDRSQFIIMTLKLEQLKSHIMWHLTKMKSHENSKLMQIYQVCTLREKSNAQTSQEIENLLNPIPTTIPTQEIPSPIEPINSPALRPCRIRTDHDYQCLNNPQAQPTDWTLEESDLTQHTESSAAKIISKNRTHLAFEDFIRNINEKSFQVLPGISDKDGLPETLGGDAD